MEVPSFLIPDHEVPTMLEMFTCSPVPVRPRLGCGTSTQAHDCFLNLTLPPLIQLEHGHEAPQCDFEQTKTAHESLLTGHSDFRHHHERRGGAGRCEGACGAQAEVEVPWQGQGSKKKRTRFHWKNQTMPHYLLSSPDQRALSVLESPTLQPPAESLPLPIALLKARHTSQQQPPPEQSPKLAHHFASATWLKKGQAAARILGNAGPRKTTAPRLNKASRALMEAATARAVQRCAARAKMEGRVSPLDFSP